MRCSGFYVGSGWSERIKEERGYARGVAVGGCGGFGIADDDSKEVLIERVIDHVHLVLAGEWTRGAIDRAREGRVCIAVGRFPDLCVPNVPVSTCMRPK